MTDHADSEGLGACMCVLFGANKWMRPPTRMESFERSNGVDSFISSTVCLASVSYDPDRSGCRPTARQWVTPGHPNA